MDSLDLGFEALVGTIAPNRHTDVLYTLQDKWYCDWVILDYLKDVAPTCDANMFRLYAEKYNIDIEMNTEEDLVELAAMYKDQLMLFVVDNLKARIDDIVKCWRDSIDLPGCASMYKIPSKCRKALLNLLLLINNTTGTDLNPQFTQFSAELAESMTAKNTYTFDRADIFEIVTKDQYQCYITAITPYIEKCFEVKDGEPFDYNLFRNRFVQTLRIVKTVMLMCMPSYELPFNDPRAFFDRFIKPKAERRVTEELFSKVRELRGLDLSHAVCVNLKNIDSVAVESEDLPETDAYCVILTTLLHDALVETENGEQTA